MRLRDHWARTAPLWEHGEPVLAWHALPAGRLDALAESLRPALDRPELTPVPPQWLHMTMRGVGRAGEVSERRRELLVADARDRLVAVAPIDATIGPVRIVDEGVLGDTSPAEPLAALFRLLPGEPGEHFWPHVSFAYAHEETETAPLGSTPSATWQIGAVSLILLHREPRLYRWDVIATVPLGGEALPNQTHPGGMDVDHAVDSSSVPLGGEALPNQTHPGGMDVDHAVDSSSVPPGAA